MLVRSTCPHVPDTVPTVVFGPRGAHHHCPGEYVELASLEPVAGVYVDTAVRYLSNPAVG